MADGWGGLRPDQRRARGGGVEWRPAWKWPDEAEALIRDQLEDAPRPVVNVCSGATEIGDLTLDLDHPRADVQADARALPLADETAGTVLMDPPWTIQNLAERQRFITEAGRVLQPGGLFLLYAPWAPSLSWAELEGVWLRHQGRHRLPYAPVILGRWRKTGTIDDRETREPTVYEGPTLPDLLSNG